MQMTRPIETAHEQYLANGFYIHPTPIISADVVTLAIDGMEAVVRGKYDTGQPPVQSPWQPGDDPGAKLVKIEMPQIASQAIQRLLTYPALGELAAQVAGARAVQVWWVQLLRKPPSRLDSTLEANVGWHQDRYYWKAWDDESELFTAWVALSDVTGAAGPMRFVGGSHNWGLGQSSDFFGQDLDALRSRIEAAGHGAWEETPAILPPGGVSFHHSLTYHGSGPNHGDAPRRSFAVHLRTENSAPRQGQREGLTRFIDNLAICPVIYGDRADFRD
jgi:hypothetical protein